MTYALDPTDAVDIREELRDLNHFVVYHSERIIGCHDYASVFERDLTGLLFSSVGVGSCSRDFVDRNEEMVSPTFSRNGTWHHVAVTWTAANDGETSVYKDGILVGSAVTEKTRPLQPNGIFMLGGRQGCFGGCSEDDEAFVGLMDEVRIWNVARTADEISKFMTRTGSAVERQEGLVAYWKFDDPLEDTFDEERLALDSSGNRNHLPLFNPPSFQEVTIRKGDVELETGALVFENSYALNSRVTEMPVDDVTVEFWAQLLIRPFDPDHPQDVTNQFRFINLMSYVTADSTVEDSTGDGFRDDVLSIYLDMRELNSSRTLGLQNFSSRGSVWVILSGRVPLWIEFDTKWIDAEWHHIALTYDSEDSVVQLFFDGEEALPFWKLTPERIISEHPDNGGAGGVLPVEPRNSEGSLALGKYQGCFAGCFSTWSTLHGKIANFRIWNRALSPRWIANSMWQSLEETNTRGLVLAYEFSEETLIGEGRIGRYALDQSGDASLFLGSVMPHYEFSYAPLTNRRGRPLSPPSPGVTGYALQLSDQHIVALSNFSAFPTEAVTVEFWMWSIDQCYGGVPFSYSALRDGQPIDMLTLLDYNSWVLIVDGDVGGSSIEQPSFGSTDGTWHHIAFTWDRSTGRAALYDNGRLHWIGDRSTDALVPGGTLVIGREQDCVGGCFDSALTAFNGSDRGPFERIQDFFGLIDNIRLWSVVRSGEDIFAAMRFDLDEEEGVPNDFLSASDTDLVAWWKFDEGKGRTVGDATGNGHELKIRGEPLWVVSNRLGSCGDGLLSQTEECDDGNRRDGDGCSFDCRVEVSLEELAELVPQLEPEEAEMEAASALDELLPAVSSQTVEFTFLDPAFNRTQSSLDDGLL